MDEWTYKVILNWKKDHHAKDLVKKEIKKKVEEFLFRYERVIEVNNLYAQKSLPIKRRERPIPDFDINRTYSAERLALYLRI